MVNALTISMDAIRAETTGMVIAIEKGKLSGSRRPSCVQRSRITLVTSLFNYKYSDFKSEKILFLSDTRYL